jgi:hypothetical protein
MKFLSSFSCTSQIRAGKMMQNTSQISINLLTFFDLSNHPLQLSIHFLICMQVQLPSGLWSLSPYSLPFEIMICYPAPPGKERWKVFSETERETVVEKILFREREVMGNPRNTERKPIGASEVQHGLHFFFFFFYG